MSTDPDNRVSYLPISSVLALVGLHPIPDNGTAKLFPVFVVDHAECCLVSKEPSYAHERAHMIGAIWRDLFFFLLFGLHLIFYSTLYFVSVRML